MKEIKQGWSTDTVCVNYTPARNKVTRLIRQAKRKFEMNIAQNCKGNPKLFWAHVHNKLKTKTGVAPLLEEIDNKNSINFSDEDKANILQKQFSSVYTQEPAGTIPRLSKRTDINIPELHITYEMVKIKIINMN